MVRRLDSDASALLLSLFAATAMIAQQVAGKATRDALFLSNFDVTNLPKIVILSAIASMAGVLLMSRLLSRISPMTLVPLLFGLSAVLFIGEWLLLETQARITSVVLYLHMAVFGAILISGFWSIINERFDPHSAKQRVARIAAAAAFGGVIGGILVNQVSAQMDVRSMLLFLSGLHLVCMLAVRGIGAQSRAVPLDAAIKARSAFTVIHHTRYLQWMAALMILIAVMAAFADYALKAEATLRYKDSEDLVSFLATFYATVGLLGFIVQSLVGHRILQKFGIRTTIAILPAMVAAFGTLGTLLPQLWSMVMLRGGQTVFTNSLFRSSFELLYMPLPPHKKRPTKTIIDVASDRVGDLLGGGLLLLLLFLIPELPTAVVAGCAVAVAMLALVVIAGVNKEYIRQLAYSLRKGVVRIEEHDIIDATTRQLLAEADAVSERDILQARILAMQDRKASDDDDENTEPEDSVANFARAVEHLASGDPARAQLALASTGSHIPLVPYMVPLLANDDIADDIRTELRWLVPRVTGQLTDALMDPDQPLLARQRLPSVLEASHNPRTIEGLLSGLVDTPFNVRFSCARALARMRERDDSLQVSPERIHAAIRGELEVSADEWKSHSLDALLDAAGAESPDDPTINYSLEHVFSLLALILDPDAVHLAMQAAFSDDRNLQGTALEYLENVLPADLYAALAQRLGHSDDGASGSRTLLEVVRDLRSVVNRPDRHR